MQRNANKATRNAQVLRLRHTIWQEIAYTQHNVAKELAERAQLLVEPEDRYTLMMGFSNAAKTAEEVITLLKAVNYNSQNGKSDLKTDYSLQTALLYKTNIATEEQRKQVKQYLRPEDHIQFDGLMNTKEFRV